MSVGKLHNRVAIVTGAAQGIGAGIALELASNGADVCVNYVGDSVQTQDIMSQIQKLGRRAIAYEADVSDRAAVEMMVEHTIKTLGPVSILVTNAICSVRNSILDTKFEELQRTLNVGIYGVFHCMQVVARIMVRDQIKGAIVHVSSPHARGPFKNAIDYNVAKAASLQLALSSANELMWKGIRVNVVQPGWTITPGIMRASIVVNLSR